MPGDILSKIEKYLQNNNIDELNQFIKEDFEKELNKQFTERLTFENVILQIRKLNKIQKILQITPQLKSNEKEFSLIEEKLIKRIEFFENYIPNSFFNNLKDLKQRICYIVTQSNNLTIDNTISKFINNIQKDKTKNNLLSDGAIFAELSFLYKLKNNVKGTQEIDFINSNQIENYLNKLYKNHKNINELPINTQNTDLLEYIILTRFEKNNLDVIKILIEAGAKIEPKHLNLAEAIGKDSLIQIIKENYKIQQEISSIKNQNYHYNNKILQRKIIEANKKIDILEDSLTDMEVNTKISFNSKIIENYRNKINILKEKLNNIHIYNEKYIIEELDYIIESINKIKLSQIPLENDQLNRKTSLIESFRRSRSLSKVRKSNAKIEKNISTIDQKDKKNTNTISEDYYNELLDIVTSEKNFTTNVIDEDTKKHIEKSIKKYHLYEYKSKYDKNHRLLKSKLGNLFTGPENPKIKLYYDNIKTKILNHEILTKKNLQKIAKYHLHEYNDDNFPNTLLGEAIKIANINVINQLKKFFVSTLKDQNLFYPEKRINGIFHNALNLQEERQAILEKIANKIKEGKKLESSDLTNIKKYNFAKDNELNKNHRGNNLLHISAKYGNQKAIKDLIDLGFNQKAVNAEGKTYKNLQTRRKQILKIADSIKDNKKLNTRSINNALKIDDLLDYADENANNLLHLASYKALDGLSYQLQTKKDLDQYKNNNDQSYIDIENERKTIKESLFKDLNQTSELKEEDKDKIKQYGFIRNDRINKDDKGNNLLHLAVIKNNNDLALYLKENKIDQKVKNDDKLTANKIQKNKNKIEKYILDLKEPNKMKNTNVFGRKKEGYSQNKIVKLIKQALKDPYIIEYKFNNFNNFLHEICTNIHIYGENTDPKFNLKIIKNQLNEDEQKIFNILEDQKNKDGLTAENLIKNLSKESTYHRDKEEQRRKNKKLGVNNGLRR